MRINTVAQLTGISAHALRIWERRYGAMASARSDAGYRLYTQADVERIKVIKSLLDHGHSIGEIATLNMVELHELQAAHPNGIKKDPTAPSQNTPRARFIAAIEQLDQDEAENILASARLNFDPFTLINDLILPILHEIGDRWRNGEMSVAHEHAASAVIHSQLSELLRLGRSNKTGQLFLCTTPEGETHEFGAMIAAVVLRTAGARSLYMGPSLPAEDVATAVEQSGAEAIVLSVVAMSPEKANLELAKIRKLISPTVPIYVGGSHAPDLLPIGAKRVEHYEQLRLVAMR